MNHWYLNSCKKNRSSRHEIELGLEDYMLNENMACFGIGTVEEERHLKNGFTTYKQFTHFKNHAKKDDKVYLYSNGKGVVAESNYNGHLSFEINNKGPWSNNDEQQVNIGINGWVRVEPYKILNAPRFTLSKNNSPKI